MVRYGRTMQAQFETGDVVTMDGLVKWEIVDAEHEWGLGGKNSGALLRCVSEHNEGEEIRKTNLQLSSRWRTAN